LLSGRRARHPIYYTLNIMADQYQTFHSFNDIELVNEVAEKLKQNDIKFIIEKSRPILDASLVDTSLVEPDIHLKLQPGDFEKADKVLEDYYQTQLDSIDNDYYLFSFSNDELKEILTKPDEWGHFDYQLAQKLLKERGLEIDGATANRLKQDRIKELSEPEKASPFLIFFGYCFIPFGIIVGFFIGRHLFYSKRTLPNGQTIFSYRESDRKHGNRIMIVAVILFVIIVASWFFLFLLSV
jgi:hypothetical protein